MNKRVEGVGMMNYGRNSHTVRCVLCKMKMPSYGSFKHICGGCRNEDVVHAVQGVVEGFEEFCKMGLKAKDDIASSVESQILAVLGSLLESNKNELDIITEVSGKLVGELENKIAGTSLVYGQVSIPFLSFVNRFHGARRKRALYVLELMEESGLISKNPKADSLVIDSNSTLAVIAKVIIEDPMESMKSFLQAVASGYVYLKVGVIPIYKKVIYNKEEISIGDDGITRLYSGVAKGKRIKVPSMVFATFQALLREINDSVSNNGEFDLAGIQQKLILGGRLARSELSKVIMLFEGVKIVSAPVYVLFDSIDMERRRGVLRADITRDWNRIIDRGRDVELTRY